MTEGMVVDIAREMFTVIIKASAPILLVSLVVGLIVSIFQTVTSIQEQTLAFVPKWIAILLVILICGSWIMNQIVSFTTMLYTNFSIYVR